METECKHPIFIISTQQVKEYQGVYEHSTKKCVACGEMLKNDKILVR